MPSIRLPRRRVGYIELKGSKVVQEVSQVRVHVYPGHSKRENVVGPSLDEGCDGGRDNSAMAIGCFDERGQLSRGIVKAVMSSLWVTDKRNRVYDCCNSMFLSNAFWCMDYLRMLRIFSLNQLLVLRNN